MQAQEQAMDASDAMDAANETLDYSIARVLIREDERFANDWYSADRWTQYVKDRITDYRENQ
jgi:hypothetical protein